MSTPIVAQKFTDEDFGSIKKTITTLYFKGNDIFQAIKQIKPEELNEEDKNLLKDTGLYMVASEGEIISEAVEFVNSKLASQSEGSSIDQSVSEQVNPLGDGEVDRDRQPSGDRDRQPSGDGKSTVEGDGDGNPPGEVSPKSIKAILEKVKIHVENNREGDTIKESEEDKDLNPIITVLNDKLKEEPTPNIVELIEKAIAKVTAEDYKIPDGKTKATDIAVDLITSATVGAKPESDGDTKTKDILEIKQILENTKAYVEKAENKSDDQFNVPEDDIEMKDIIEVLNVELSTNKGLDISKLLETAIKDVESKEKELVDDGIPIISDLSALDFVKNEIAKLTPSTDESDQAGKAINKKDVEKILEAAKRNIEKDGDKYKFKNDVVYDDNNKKEDLDPVLQALNAKLSDNAELNLEELLTNVIISLNKEAYILPKYTSASAVAVELINADDGFGELEDIDDDDVSDKSDKVTVKDVTDLLETEGLVKVDGEGDEKTYTINDSEDEDLQPIIEALNAKLKTEKDLNLDQVLKNAIAASKKEDYKIPENNKKSAAQIAVDIINEVDDFADLDEIVGGGRKPNKYVYGGKTVRAYPKNISFSKKNPAKKRQNKKTIRKLQKLMNKLK
jgi:hypothetical protein